MYTVLANMYIHILHIYMHVVYVGRVNCEFMLSFPKTYMLILLSGSVSISWDRWKQNICLGGCRGICYICSVQGCCKWGDTFWFSSHVSEKMLGSRYKIIEQWKLAFVALFHVNFASVVLRLWNDDIFFLMTLIIKKLFVQLKPVLEEIESRSARKEYVQILAECHRLYCEQRLSLVSSFLEYNLVSFLSACN